MNATAKDTLSYPQLLIGGRWRDPSGNDIIEVVSPSTEQLLGVVPAATRQDVDEAVSLARATFESSEWSHVTLTERIAVFERLAQLYVDRQDEIASLITSEMGCPITLSRSMQASSPRLLIEEFIAAARSFTFSQALSSPTGDALVEFEPVGVVAAVIPWNSPHSSALLKLVPALLTGCTVILKPAPETAIDAFVLAEMLAEAGLPEGVLSVLPADRTVSEYLVSRQGVDKVAFTGSTAAGRRIAALCGRDLRRVTLELGGKSAAILLDDADISGVAESLRGASFRNSGQVCTLKTRVLVPRHLQSELIESLVDVVDSMPVGDPFDPEVQIGPVVTRAQRERIEGYVRSGIESGATLVRGGERPSSLPIGWFVPATLFGDVTNDMAISREEIFGPVLSVLPYDSEDEAVRIANDSDYGLSGAVFSGDDDRALGVARRIRTGMVEVNGHGAGMSAPFGGMKASGLGREMGVEGLRSYLEIKSIGINDPVGRERRL